MQAQRYDAIARHQDHREQLFASLLARLDQDLMNHPPLRLAHPGQLPAPATDRDSLQVLTEAID